jgi:ABC-2 type transport system ATP-binding protein
MRIILGLAAPSKGGVTFDGLPYVDLARPIRTVGAAIAIDAFHPNRTAAAHLQIIALAGDVDRRRVDEVLAITALTDVAGRRVGGFSLGMKQRLSLAAALLGDPDVLVLDEPLNGLDPAGIAWLHSLLRELADDGRTVLLSSHLLAEVARTVDDVVLLHRGRLLVAAPLQQLASDPNDLEDRFHQLTSEETAPCPI